MLAGNAIMVFVNSNNLSRLFRVWATAFAIFGFGVGGEYPLTASGAAEYHDEIVYDAKMDDEAKRVKRLEHEHAVSLRRGETISIVFAMQGVGAVAGSIVLLILIVFGEQQRVDCGLAGNNETGNDPRALNSIWRSFYFIGLLLVIFLMLYRYFLTTESPSFEKVQARRIRRQARQTKKRQFGTFKIIRFYAPRLLGTSGCWLLWDIAFFGLKLFSGTIFESINPGGDLVVNNGWLLFYNVCALLGLYAGAAVIDKKHVGRKRLQMVSFLLSAIIYFITAAIFDTAPAGVIMFLFFLSSFIGNFGANLTTYVMAAEVCDRGNVASHSVFA